MACLLLINTSSGNSQKVIYNREIRDALKALYGRIDEVRMSEDDRSFSISDAIKGYEAIAVCGGDGTLYNALNAARASSAELIYVPCGTLNDSAHTLKSLKNTVSGLREIDIGEINGKLFSYVAAAGTFTPIGYIPKTKYKKLFKRLVYYFYALKEYKLYDIKAQIRVSDKVYSDTYTLIMAIKSRYVFGFGFNRLYRENGGSGHLLLIKKPEGAFKLIKLFFYFFRAFFIGFDKPRDGKYVKFLEFGEARIALENGLDFCVDGEKVHEAAGIEIRFHKKMVKILLP